jgi:hypothetical protein
MECRLFNCTVEPDMEVYNFQTDIVFNGTPIIITINGQQYVFPPGTVTLPPPGPGGVYTIESCQGTITGTNPNQVMLEYAQAQAQCENDGVPPGGYSPPPAPPPSPIMNDQVSKSIPVECEPPSEISFSGSLPAYMALEIEPPTLYLSAGIFSGTSKTDANNRAQQYLDDFVANAIANNLFVCGEFENTEQSVSCPDGESDANNTNIPIDEFGISVVNGTVIAAAGYYTSAESQEAADASALEAAQSRFDALTGDSTIDCQPGCEIDVDFTLETNCGSMPNPPFSNVELGLPADWGVFPVISGVSEVRFTCTSPTLKTWKISGGRYGFGDDAYIGWEKSPLWPNIPSVSVGGVPQSIVTATFGEDDEEYWKFDTVSGVCEFQTDACSPVEVIIVVEPDDSALSFRPIILIAVPT